MSPPPSREDEPGATGGEGSLPAHERRWPASVTVAAVLAVQLALPAQVSAGPRLLLPGLELALLVPIVVTNPVRLSRDTVPLRWLALGLTTLLGLVNAVHLLRLVQVLTTGHTASGRVLVQAALLIWVTNVATCAVGLREVDRGGPFARGAGHPRVARRPDLLFTQMTGVPGWDPTTWRPSFVDYLYTAFTSATAFSPTDTLPLSARAKLIMAATQIVALLTVAVVAARAVNVL